MSWVDEDELFLVFGLLGKNIYAKPYAHIFLGSKTFLFIFVFGKIFTKKKKKNHFIMAFLLFTKSVFLVIIIIVWEIKERF